MGEGSPAGTGYRPPAPSAEAFVRWPDAFGTRFSLFVDTEEEFDWQAPLSRDERSTRAVSALPALHARFAERGVPVTYLVDHPIASDARAVDLIGGLLQDGRSAVGSQLHGWVTPPFEEEVNGFNSFAGNLPLALERAKIVTLTDLIERAFGSRPRSYRAGRYGIGPHTLPLLAELGYRLDSSMRAGYDYSAEGGPDFGSIGNAAFRSEAMVEIPFSTVFTGMLRGGGAGLYRAFSKLPRGRGIASRLGLLSRVSLTPEDMPREDALEAVRIAVGEGQRLLNFAFHSPSAEPGHTPYVRTAEDLADLHRWWDSVLDLLDRLGVRPASEAELIAAACGEGSGSANAAAAGGL